MLQIILLLIGIILVVLGVIGKLGPIVQVVFLVVIPALAIVWAIAIFASDKPWVWLGVVIIAIIFIIWTFHPYPFQKP